MSGGRSPSCDGVHTAFVQRQTEPCNALHMAAAVGPKYVRLSWQVRISARCRKLLCSYRLALCFILLRLTHGVFIGSSHFLLAIAVTALTPLTP